MISTLRRQQGYILLEALITIVILALGLLGLAGLQTRVTVAEQEGYQRAHALILAQDMVDRVYANRANAANYIQNDIGASGVADDCTVPTTLAGKDVCEWGNSLIGVSEKVGTTNVGTLLGGRGCVTAGAANEYFVTITWQGLVQTSAQGGVACGQNQYGNDALRRVVSMRVVISDLAAP